MKGKYLHMRFLRPVLYCELHIQTKNGIFVVIKTSFEDSFHCFVPLNRSKPYWSKFHSIVSKTHLLIKKKKWKSPNRLLGIHILAAISNTYDIFYSLNIYMV